jgi:hypothetical protein
MLRSALMFAGFVSSVAAVVGPAARAAEELKPLWQIGKPDGRTDDLALGPGQYARYGEDPVFVCGQSAAQRDWPYCHPGPADAWAEGRSHVFTVLFGVKARPARGQCRLQLALADVQRPRPPRLAVALNGRRLGVYPLPGGGGDESIRGDLSKAAKHSLAIIVPCEQLAVGVNELTLEALSGSWLLYDALWLEAPATVEPAAVERVTLVSRVQQQPALVEQAGRLMQTVQLSLVRAGQPTQATVEVGGAAPQQVAIKPGRQVIDVPVPAVEKETKVTVALKADGQTVATREIALSPVRRWTVYLLPHSHVDIGYTHVQTEVDAMQRKFFDISLDLSRRTADYPPGCHYKWNSEVLWAVESYLKLADDERKQAFLEAVRKGWIGLDGMYGNELTALCRPEELLRLFDFARRLRRDHGLPVESAMISDVPGYTWGIVPAMAQSGIKYFSIGPNRGDRIGFTLAAWGDKPFYWVSPSGQERVLCWMSGEGYSLFHGGRLSNENQVFASLARLEAKGYPYDIVQFRYNIGGDNGPPDPNIADFVKDWNARRAYPKLAIATTAEAFAAFEKQYGDKLPEVRGDFTPYWEDGAASSALETSANRHAAERLLQGEALWAMLSPKQYPADEFYAAWRNAVLYDEHTWGAHSSISQPDSDFAKNQWKIKQTFAADAATQSLALARRVAGSPATSLAPHPAIMVYNTTSWPRTAVVSADADPTQTFEVLDDRQQPVPAQQYQRLLWFRASDVPAFGARRYTLRPGPGAAAGKAKAEGLRISNGTLEAVVDERTGGIKSLRGPQADANLVAESAGFGLNDYFYVPGKNPADAQRAANVRVSVQEPGPLVAALRIESDAPGCNRLVRGILAMDGADSLILTSIVDKQPIRAKEGVHLGFPLNVPGGVMRMDLPWAVARPEDDQLPGACKNWFTVQRWLDVSNDRYGVTCAIVDAPLVEVGAITAETPWIEKLAPSQTFFSYVMNNYWHTNYKADQEGPTLFRYALRPHRGGFRAIEAAKFGIEQSQPLLTAVAPHAAAQSVPSRLKVEGEGLIATLKPSDDRKALIVRLFAAGGESTKARIAWADPQPTRVRLSNLAEEPLGDCDGTVALPAFGIATVRAELP